MPYREFVSLVHKSTKRDYLARVTERDKAEVAELALQWGYDYWDGSRQTGYGGYRYDGRWRCRWRGGPHASRSNIDWWRARPRR